MELVKYYIFFGLPPAKTRAFMRSTQEDKFFDPLSEDGHQVSRIIFIDSQATTPFKRAYIPKNLNGFLHLDGKLGPKELAKRILGHFAGEW